MAQPKTALQLIYELLGLPLPAPNKFQPLRSALQRTGCTEREREVVSYLLTVSREQSHAQGGSLKHVLWWLRDYAGELYEVAASETLQLVLQHGNTSLDNVLPVLKQYGRTVGLFTSYLREGTDRATLAAHLRWLAVGAYKIAVNETMLNLTSIAFQQGADLHVAVSERGAVLVSQRGLQFVEDVVLGNGWTRIYPNLFLYEGDTPRLLDAEALAHEAVGYLRSVKS